jgi:peptide/nickel transport system permease protein
MLRYPRAIRYAARRVALALVVVAGVVILTFAIADLVPGDPAATWAGPHASAAQLARARQYLGLNEPLPVRIGRYFGGIATGDWGTSIHTHQPVLSDIGTAAPATLELVIAALVIAVAVGIPLGLAAARWPGSVLDHVIRVGSVLGVSMPVFWFALILQLVFAQRLHVLPVAGEYDPNLLFSHPLLDRTQVPVLDALISGNWAMLGSTLDHLILPALVVASYPAGVIARMTRAQVLDTLGETHVQMVRSLGFRERTVIGTFAMKLAWNPVAAVLALVFAYSLVNTFLVESLFDWPGLGSYTAASVAALDTPAILGVTLFIAIVYVAANLAVDLVQAALDPRIRLR